MKTKFMLKVISILFLFVLVFGCSKVPKFEHYGVYIKTKSDFKEIKSFDWSSSNDIYYNSKNYDKTEISFENELEIYIYSPKAKMTEYHLIVPSSRSRNGDFKCANMGRRKCPEKEITVKPIKGIDDMVMICSKINDGTFILHLKEESKGYVFNAKKNHSTKKKNSILNSNSPQEKILGKWNIDNGDEIITFKSDGIIEGERNKWELSDKAPFHLKIISQKGFVEEFIVTFINDNKMVLVELQDGDKHIAIRQDIKQSLSDSHNKKYKKEIKKTIRNWIVLINKSKYKEFVVDFKTPAMVEYSKNSGEFENIIDDFLPHKSKFIKELKKMLQEEPIINQDFVSFKNSDMKLCKINGKWYQYISYEKSPSKPVEAIK